MPRPSLLWLVVPGLTCAALAQPLPGTGTLDRKTDFAAEMLTGIDRYLTRELTALGEARAGSRERLREIIGAVDTRVDFPSPALDAFVDRSSLIADLKCCQVHRVRWPVLAGVDAEGLLLRPKERAPVAQIVALPDAGDTPEALAGLVANAQSPYARRLAESGALVLVPVLIDRGDAWSGNPETRFTNQPHREFVYRMAFEMGRHIIGYEVQKVLAAVDWFKRANAAAPVGVTGYGEGGLIALYAAALDTRIDRAVVSGYFGPRRELWREPIYRNVWGLLREFSDAGLAGMIAPRRLVIEHTRHPEVAGPPPERDGRRGAAPGRIATPPAAEVRAEYDRARSIYARAGAPDRITFADASTPGSDQALEALLGKAPLPFGETPVPISGLNLSPRARRQFDQLVEFTQSLVRRAERTRAEFFWSKMDSSTADSWRRGGEPFRKLLWEEVIGKLPAPDEPLSAQTRRLYDLPAFTGYEVVIPVWRDAIAYGILLVPKDLKKGERRPVVVAQHGLEGRPQALVDPTTDRELAAYQRYAARLAERGFVVYAPQNPYIFGERFRTLVRKANPLKLTLYSFILGQHERTLDWLSSLDFVDPSRIAFYGLSYGGKTAMRAPPLLDRYSLSICSADFNEWIWKITSTEQRFSYMYTGEYELLEFNLGNTFNYAELAALIAPRPFMVERGHHDGVSVDEWVAYEYAKVRRLFALLRQPDRTAIEFFNGPHSIYGNQTFEFLHRHLRWP